MEEKHRVAGWDRKDSTHAAYVAFTKGYKSKFAYFMRTIDSFEDYVEPIDEVINDIFLPVLFCQTGPLPDELREPFPISASTRGSGYTTPESWNLTAIRCLKVNKSTA